MHASKEKLRRPLQWLMIARTTVDDRRTSMRKVFRLSPSSGRSLRMSRLTSRSFARTSTRHCAGNFEGRCVSSSTDRNESRQTRASDPPQRRRACTVQAGTLRMRSASAWRRVLPRKCRMFSMAPGISWSKKRGGTYFAFFFGRLLSGLVIPPVSAISFASSSLSSDPQQTQPAFVSFDTPVPAFGPWRTKLL